MVQHDERTTMAADDYPYATEPGTEGLDFHLTEAERKGEVAVDDNGYARQPGTEGLDFHLTPEDIKTDHEVKDRVASALAEDKTAADLETLAGTYGVSHSGSKYDVALRLVQAGYPEAPTVTTDGDPA